MRFPFSAVGTDPCFYGHYQSTGLFTCSSVCSLPLSKLSLSLSTQCYKAWTLFLLYTHVYSWRWLQTYMYSCILIEHDMFTSILLSLLLLGFIAVSSQHNTIMPDKYWQEWQILARQCINIELIKRMTPLSPYYWRDLWCPYMYMFHSQLMFVNEIQSGWQGVWCFAHYIRVPSHTYMYIQQKALLQLCVRARYLCKEC